MRLVDKYGNTGGSSGRLEVFLNGHWGTVCFAKPDHVSVFDDNDANVACRQLGYAGFQSSGYSTVEPLG